MDGLFWNSSTWRWIVREGKRSNVFFAGFSVVCVGVCGAAAVGLQALTNPGTVELSGKHKSSEKQDAEALNLQKQLLLRGRPDAMLIGRVNTERLGQMLEEVQKKENTEDRYAAALRGETLVGPPKGRHVASGSSAIAYQKSQEAASAAAAASASQP